MRRIAILLGATALLTGCLGGSGPEDTTGTGIRFERNSQFSTQYMRVFLGPGDDRPALSVNTLDDAVSTAEAAPLIPGHMGREWMFLKEEDHGTSKVHAIGSWDPNAPEDYLMIGWWAYFPGQQPPDLDPFDRQGSTIVDGPEFDTAFPPDMPVAGTASYEGPALGTYSFRPAERPEDVSPEIEDFYVADGWQGHATLTADFEAGMVHGCIGCEGDLVHRNALVAVRHPDVQFDPTQHEIHLLAHAFDPEAGIIDGATSEVRHPSLEVTESDGGWGGFFSNRPDEAGNPRILGGFAWNSFDSEDGRARLVGLFIGLSDGFAAGE